MSGKDADQPRAKRRRCAPKRYAEEDDASSSRDETAKSSPESSTHQQQQQQKQQQQQQHRIGHCDALPAAPLSWHCSKYAKPAEPEESKEAQALRVIHQLAVKLKKQDRPHLRILFSQTEEQRPRLPTFRYKSSGSAVC